ncbi:1-deoxy-D-xylulose 5-phosphate reductoisomerase [bacterium BMS3Abin02]|nr:1-deoxy-D-xylulose 5-phosphate reductoisomerase [bacterium BMS3Abin02]GBE21560.1 1-deoxy-D-xylulose 5-phosphate reductoisomerase [bacterium BMS3Bbin01]HDH27437.1 1-deoxy-D-xylulose-5-phosphate reductoisomerase [Actinomycetota bacterium]
MTRPLIVLGVTGSIGRQVIEVAQRLGREVKAFAARRGSDALAELAETFPEALIGVAAPTGGERERFGSFGSRVRFGPEALVELASIPGTVVVNGVVGSAGLGASVAALEAGNRLALANKESLVAGGPVVLDALRRGGGELIPVDSEHSALFQCLVGERSRDVRRLILTASGGPLRSKTRDEIANVTPAEALAHPTWSMGPRITIDSATLVNKGFEVIEAHHLFGMEYESIDVVVHPQSIVHSLVEFEDGSLKAQIGEPDMRIPIQYAITYPNRERGGGRFDLAGKTLTFFEPDGEAFPAFGVVLEAGRRGGSTPAAVNAADEIAVRAFLDGRLGLLGIASVLEQTIERIPTIDVDTVDDVLAVDAEARAVASSLIGGAC